MPICLTIWSLSIIIVPLKLIPASAKTPYESEISFFVSASREIFMSPSPP